MAQGRISRAAQHDASNIGAGARVRGRVTGDGDLVVAGQVEGDILVRGDVTIDAGGACTSNVEGHAVTVSGSLEGDVAASGPILLGSTARVRGSVRGASFAMEDGASFAGRVECEFDLPGELGDAPAPGPARARR